MNTHRQNQTNTNRKRRGVLSMELVLTLPILMIVLFALFEMSLLFYARGIVAEASRAGAQKAALAGVNQDDVEDEVRRVLGSGLTRGTRVKVELAEYSGDPVAVTIKVPMLAASPDLLWPIGFRLAGRDLISETRMVRE